MPLTPDEETTIRKHSLDIKRDDELDAMRTSHADKLARLREPHGDLDKFIEAWLRSKGDNKKN